MFTVQLGKRSMETKPSVRPTCPWSPVFHFSACVSCSRIHRSTVHSTVKRSWEEFVDWLKKLMPLIRPSFLGGGIGGVPLDSHEKPHLWTIKFNLGSKTGQKKTWQFHVSTTLLKQTAFRYIELVWSVRYQTESQKNSLKLGEHQGIKRTVAATTERRVELEVLAV